jgi:hypothetical protein
MIDDNRCPKCNRYGFESDARSGHKVRICPWHSCGYHEHKMPEELDPVLNKARINASKSANPRQIFGNLYKGFRDGKVILENKQDEKCPNCNADQKYRNPSEYECGSWIGSGKMEFHQSKQCAINGIKKEKKQIFENIENSISSFLRSTNKSVSEYDSTEELLRNFIAYVEKLISHGRSYQEENKNE